MTPTARALQQLRKDGWLPAVVERWNPGARVRQDLFGFLDIVAIGSQSGGVFGIQVTTGAHVADRLAKIKSEPVVARVRVWLAAGNALEVWGWSKQGPRGKRKTWTLRREPVWLQDVSPRHLLTEDKYRGGPLPTTPG